MVMFKSSLATIREVADDVESYFQFGLALANYIAVEIHKAAQKEGMIVFRDCPPCPPMPQPVRPIST
jgi:hypothetical protein